MTRHARRTTAMTAGCARHRSALLDLVVDPQGADLRPADRAHLDACASCRAEATELSLMSIALRRSLAPAREAQPSADALPALRARVLRQRGIRTVGRLASPVLSAVMAGGLAVALLVPVGMPSHRSPVLHEAGIDPSAIRAAGQRDAEDEALRQHALTLAGKQAAGAEEPARSLQALIRYESDQTSAVSVEPRSPFSAAAQ